MGKRHTPRTSIAHANVLRLQEPQQNLDCPDLIEEYESRLLQKNRFMNNDASTLKRKPSLDQAPVHNKRGRPPLDRSNYNKQQPSAARSEEASAFDRGFEAEKILGATDATVGAREPRHVLRTDLFDVG